MQPCVERFLCDEEAATAVEYSVILSLILMAVLVAVGAVGLQTAGLWGDVATSIQSAAP